MKPITLLVLLLGLIAVPLQAAPPTTAPTTATTSETEARRYDLGQFDFHTLLGEPPALGSNRQTVDMNTSIELTSRRTPAQAKQCAIDDKMTAFNFSDELGPHFNPDDLPMTASILKHLGAEGKAIGNSAKSIWNRPRPPVTNPAIRLCIPLEKSTSYPSGHALRSRIWAEVLGRIFPEKRDALLAHADRIAMGRVIAGEHYASDVAAGKKLGAEIARRLFANPKFQAELAVMEDECQSVPAS